MIGFVLFLCLTIQGIGTYIVWPSRYNIAAHMNLGFIFVAYFVPLVILDFSQGYATQIINLYFLIITSGTVFYVIGLLVGNYLPLIRIRYIFHYLPNDAYSKKVISITKNCVIFGIIGMLISFAIMGYVPAFTSDPLSAKFFKGPYHDPYMRIAILYRLSFFLLQTMMPIIIIVWYRNKTLSNLLLVILPIIILTLTLSRGAAFQGILFGLAIICAYRSRMLIFLYSLALVIIFTIGSIAFYVVGIIFGIDSLTNLLPEGNFWELIAFGSPDVSDQLTFLTSFNSNSIYTYGRTIFGGLIPGNYIWNPSIYTLTVTNPGTEITDIASGGLRLPLPMWGYVSFGWPGVILYSLLSGLITSYCIKYARQWLINADLFKVTIVILLLLHLGNQLSDFYLLNMYNFLIIVTILLYCYQLKLR